ncbi:MAG: carboxy terminal-processing peptidase [Pirellulaceae bacterium]
MRRTIDNVRWGRIRVVQVIALCAAISAGLLTASLLTSWAADLTGPQASDRQVARMVMNLMRREHLSKHPLDDDMSRRGFTNFIKSLDPMKVYFYQSDIDEFKKSELQIDDDVASGDISLAYTIFNRFLQRIDERVATVDELLKLQPDFTLDEEMIIEPDKAEYAKTKEEAYERWRKRIKYDRLVLKGDETEGAEAVERLTKRYHSFAKRMHQTDSSELLEMYLTAITSTFDPHTTYMSDKSFENFKITMRLELDGIGAALSSTDGMTMVTKIIPGGAADKHGKLQVEDQIVSVGQGEDGEMVEVIDMKLSNVVDMIRGKRGTIVRLGVIPAGQKETKVYNITRAEIKLSDSEARGVIFEEGKKEDGSPLKVGVIDLPSFYMDLDAARSDEAEFKSTTRDMRRILEDFKSKGVDAVVVDLRRNGGGSLTESINATGLFIDQGPVVQVKDSAGKVQHYDDLDHGMVWEGPLVVLTSKFSASASEIFAGAIQDYRRGIIVGDEATHGKGTVQSLLDLGPQLFRIPNPPNLGALKITMQQFYRPNGDSTQKRGVLADVALPSLSANMDVGEGDLDYALEFDRVPAALYHKLSMVTPEILTQLRLKSQARRQQSEKFAKRQRDIERYVEQKARETVSLNEKEFFADREELNADKEDQKTFEELNNGGEEIVKKDYYFDEILAITRDYIDQLKVNRIAAK